MRSAPRGDERRGLDDNAGTSMRSWRRDPSNTERDVWLTVTFVAAVVALTVAWWGDPDYAWVAFVGFAICAGTFLAWCWLL